MEGTSPHSMIDRLPPRHAFSRVALAGLLCATLSGCAVFSAASARRADPRLAKHRSDSIAYSRAQAEADAGDGIVADDNAAAARPRGKTGPTKSEPLKAAVNADTDRAESRDGDLHEVQTLVSGISTRVDAIEGKLTRIDEKLDTTRASIDALAHSQTAHAAQTAFGTRTSGTSLAVTAHPADSGGTHVEEIAAESDPEAGFSNDSAVQAYRRALITFQARNYPESVLAFSTFLERNPDHPLAGSAQYYVGASYLQQKEYKLAAQELGRGLARYSRGPRIAETLRDLAETEDRLRQPEAAARHRQLLSSLFPASPAATRLASAARPLAPETLSREAATPRPSSSTFAAAHAAAAAEERRAAVSTEIARKPDAVAEAPGLDPMPIGLAPPTAPIADPSEARAPASAAAPAAPAQPPARSTESVPSATGRSEIHAATEPGTDAHERAPRAAGALDPSPADMNDADFTSYDKKTEAQ